MKQPTEEAPHAVEDANLVPLSPEVQQQLEQNADPIEAPPEQVARIWVSRVTGVVGALCLIIALSLWIARAHHYRLVLAFLTVAMFAAILHSYVFDTGDEV